MKSNVIYLFLKVYLRSLAQVTNHTSWIFPFMLLLGMANHIPLLAQAPTLQWAKIVGGDTNDNAYAIIHTAEGGYLVGGTSDSDISGSRTASKKGITDFWLVKLDAAGNKLWDKSYGGSANNGLQAIVTTSDGGYLLGGYSSSAISGDKTEPSRGGTDFWIVKIDASGTKLWDKTFGGSGEDYISSLVKTDDGFLLAGYSSSGINGDKTQANRGGNDFWIIKINSMGGKQWDYTFGGNTRDELFSAIATTDGGFMIGGISDSGVSGDKTQSSRGGVDYWVIKLTSTGQKQWDKTFGGSNNPDYYKASDHFRSLLQTEDGGYLLAGFSNTSPGADKTAPKKGTEDYDDDYWVVKINSAGIKQWDKTYGGEYWEYLRVCLKSPAGGYVLIGDSGSGISGDKTEEIVNGGGDPWLIKINTDGEKQWDKTFGDIAIEEVYASTVNNKGEYALAGLRVQGILTNFDIFKTNPEPFIAVPAININFQNAQTIAPAGYLRDYGQAFGIRSSANQGNGYIYGWKARANDTPIDLSVGGSFPGNGRWRPAPSEVRLATFMHMQADDVLNFRGVAVEAYWEIALENGNYQVSVSVGDGMVHTSTDPESHSINIEGVNAISGFIPSGPQGSLSRFKSATVDVTVTDGLLTIDADGGQNTKINYAIIQPLQASASALPAQVALAPVQSAQAPAIRASPNPFSDRLTLQSKQLSGRLDITIIDALGNQLYHTVQSSQAGEVQLDVSAASLKTGIYLVKILGTDGSTRMIRVIKK